MVDGEDLKIKVKTPENLIVYDPDNLPYEKQYLCLYLRELLDEEAKASQD
jgi:hypothetical protein